VIATLLGTGTSQGVPVIGCDCPVCISDDHRDSRLRTSVLIRSGSVCVGIDCGPDFRQQMLRARVSRLDALLVTHEHNDHVIGMDDIRPFNFINWQKMPVYATDAVQGELKKRFPYIFEEKSRYPGAPMVELLPLHKDVPFAIGDLAVTPIEVMHGKLPVLGFRFGGFAYITDMSAISAQEEKKLRGVEVLVVNALHFDPHHSHLNVEGALEFIRRIGPKQAFLTHVSHRIGLHAEVDTMLPSNVALGYDGLEIRVPGTFNPPSV
jgi:phosphoribosyl 1,2-cyclic phosphate phosphodiesterase